MSTYSAAELVDDTLAQLHPVLYKEDMFRPLACALALLASTLAPAQTNTALPPIHPQQGSGAGKPPVVPDETQAGPQLSPAEELKAAMMPFDAVRQQPDDLTEADLLALKVGQNQAAAACLRDFTNLPPATVVPDELLALARLCLFGQQYAQAQKAATQSLQTNQDGHTRPAKELLIQAFLGLHDPINAAIQVRSLLGETTFDGSLQTLLMRVVGTGALRQGQWRPLTHDLCTAQVSNSLKLLETGASFAGTEGASPSRLYRDTLFCVQVLQYVQDSVDSQTLKRLADLPASSAWQTSAERVPMHLALDRFNSEQKRSPELEIRGEHIGKAGPPTPRTLHLERGSFLLVPFTLWAADTTRIVSDLTSAAPSLPITLLTSWAANSGGRDQPDPQNMARFRALAAQLPPTVSVLVVSDLVLQRFHPDVYPAAITVIEGVVQVNIPMDNETAERMALISVRQMKAPVATPQASVIRP